MVTRTFAALALLATSGCATGYSVGADSVDLGLDMQQQEASQWCWAAAAQSVAAWSGAPVTQSQVVSESFGRECSPATCNAPYNPIKYLTGSAGLHITGWRYGGQTADFWRGKLAAGVPIVALLTNSQPIGSGGGTVGLTSNHFVVVSGYTADKFIVLDPAHPEPKHLSWLDLQDYGALHMHVQVESTIFITL